MILDGNGYPIYADGSDVLDDDDDFDYDLIDDATDEELGFEEEDYDIEDDSFFDSEFDPFESDLGDEY